MTTTDPGPSSSTPNPAAWLARLRGIVVDAARTVDRSLVMVEHVVRRAGELVRAVDRDGRQAARDAVLLWDSVVRAAEEAQATAQSTPRVARVVGEVVRLASAYRLFHVAHAWRDEVGREEALDALHAREAARIRALCEELGGGVLKVGQFLSCRADLLPHAWIAELSLLQDRVPAEAPEAIAALLEAELGGPLAEVLPGFDPTPIAAASLAEVHTARLGHDPDGPAVAVKVQRPGIGAVLASDRRAMTLVAQVLGDALPFDARTVTTELARSLADELDYPAEAAHAARFRAALAPLGVKVPEVLRATDKVLVMELVRGERLVPWLERADAAGRDHVLGQLARATAEAVLVHGLVHADPHPGNFLVADGGPGADPAPPPTLVLLDFGAVNVLSDAERKAYVELLPLLFGGDVARITAVLERMGFAAPDPGVAVAYAREIIGKVITTDDLSGIDPRAELERGLELARQNPGLRVPPHFVQLGRSLAGLAGLFLTFKPKVALGRVLVETLARSG